MEELKVLVKENKQNIVLFGLVVAALAVILIGILAWGVPMIPACIFVLLEAGLAVCLQDLPVWLHGAILIVQLVVGLIFGNGIFIMTCAVYYAAGILMLSLCDK